MDDTQLDWDKGQGLMPAIVQDLHSGAVLMLGYMNRDALEATRATGRVTFWSRSKGRLWTKGESSGHFLDLHHIEVDCDGDTLLVLAKPNGPTCHLGTTTCWGEAAQFAAQPAAQAGAQSTAPPAAQPAAHFAARPAAQAAVQRLAFLGELEDIIAQRITERPAGSYTAKLLGEGTRRIAQKVGEEGLELALAAVAQSDAEIIGEAADLLYHTLLLLKVKGLSLADVIAELTARHAARG